MNKKSLAALSFAGLIGMALPYTSSASPISMDYNPAISNAQEFDNLATSVDEHNGERIKIAGQIIRAEETEEGVLVTAEFLPYPMDDLHFTDTAEGQPKPSKGKGRFSILYPTKKKVKNPEFIWKGNKFILLGDVNGKRKVPITLTGRSISVPHIVANCVRVWVTGGSEVSASPDTEFTAYPPLARTFCVD